MSSKSFYGVLVLRLFDFDYLWPVRKMSSMPPSADEEESIEPAGGLQAWTGNSTRAEM